MASLLNQSKLSKSTCDQKQSTKIFFEVKNFKNAAVGSFQESKFNLLTKNDVKFILYCNPNQSTSFYSDKITYVFLYLDSNVKTQHCVKYQISILKTNGEKFITQKGITNISNDFRYFGEFRILRKYILSTGNDLLDGDKITISCKIQEIYAQNGSISKIKNNQIVQDYQSLLESAKFSDASLKVSDKEFKIHKAILSARSKVFAAMFENDCEEKRQNLVEIIDISAEVCAQMLSYIYTGDIPDMKESATDLFVAADKYQLEHLKTVCEKYIGTTLSIDSVAETFLVADMHDAANLKSKCIDYIVDNATKVMATDGWKALITPTSARMELVVNLFQKLALKTNH